jgi:hypothetical protein
LRTGDHKVRNDASAFFIGKTVCIINGERECGVQMWVRVKRILFVVVVVVVIVVVVEVVVVVVGVVVVVLVVVVVMVVVVIVVVVCLTIIVRPFNSVFALRYGIFSATAH